MRGLSLTLMLLSIVLAGCSREIPVTGDEQKSVLAYAEPVTDSLLKGFNDGDYALYARDFDEAMKNALPEKVFRQTREMILGKIGTYKSRVLDRVFKKDQYTVVLYKAAFEKEEGVSVKVVFAKFGEKNLVSGLWFNSPRLRQ